MPGGSTPPLGNCGLLQALYLPLVTVPNVTANASATQTFNVPGVNLGDIVLWNMQSNVTGISCDNIFVSAANTLTFYWSNTTTSNVTGTAAQPFVIAILRPSVIPSPSGLGSALV